MQQQNQQHIPYFAQDSDLIDDDSKFKSYGVINQQKIKEAKYEINIISSNDSVLQAYQQEVSMSQESSSTLNLGAALQNNSNSNMSDIRHSNLNKIIMAPDQITQFDTMGEEFYNQLNQEYNENLQDEENEVSVVSNGNIQNQGHFKSKSNMPQLQKNSLQIQTHNFPNYSHNSAEKRTSQNILQNQNSRESLLKQSDLMKQRYSDIHSYTQMQQQTLQQYINDYQEVDFERLDQTTMDRDNINNRTLMQGSLSEIQKDRPLSLLEKNNKFRSSMIQDQSQDSIQKSQRNDLLKEIEIQQDEHQLSFSKTLPQKVQLLECDHLNTSHEELIDFSKPFGEARSPQVISNNLLLPKFNFNLTGSVTPVNLNHTQEMNFTNNFQMVQRQQFKAKRLEEKRQQLEKELHKCIVQQQIYSNKLQQRTSQDIKIENSKLDIGLARCFINRNIMSKYLSQDKAEEAEVFYALEVRTPDNGPSINNQDNVVKIQRFESDKITMKSQSQLLQWNQTFTVNLEQGLETISLKVYMFSITLGNIEIEKLEIQIDNQLPKLMDQKIKQVPFITEKECAFEIIVKWRYDDTKQKFQEISKRIRKIRQMLEQYTKRVNDAVSENSPVVNQAKSNFDRVRNSNFNSNTQQQLQQQQLEYGFVEIYNATPHFSNGQMKKEQNTDEYSTTGQKKKVLARLTSSRSPSKYSSGRLSQLGSKSDHSQSRLSLAPNTTHLKQSQNIMPAPNHLSSVVNRQANSPKHSRIPSFSNTNDFGILSKTSRIHYQQNQHDKDEFSTVQLDQDSPDDKLKMKESNEFVRQSKRSKINRLQNQLEKKFQKIGNMTVKIPTRNSSVALTSQNQTKEQELKKESLIDIKDRVKRQNQSISVGDFQQQNNLAHKDTTSKQRHNQRLNQVVRVVRKSDNTINTSNCSILVNNQSALGINQNQNIRGNQSQSSNTILRFTPQFTSPPHTHNVMSNQIGENLNKSSSKTSLQSHYLASNSLSSSLLSQTFTVHKKKNSNCQGSITFTKNGTKVANIQLQNAQTSPKLSSPDQNAQSQNDEIQKSYIYSNSPLESAKVITNYQKAQLILGSENLDQNEESFGINKEQKLSARVSEIPQFKGILPSQMATQMIKDRQSIQHEIKGKGKNITSIINSTNFSQTQTLKKNESLKHFVPASHHTKPNVQQSSQVHSSTINLKTQQIQQKYQNQKFSSTTQQVSQNPEQLHFQNSQIVNNSNYSSKQNSLTASQINLNQNNFNTNRQPQSKQITITDIKNLKRKKSIELSMLKSARSSLNSSIDSKRHATGLIKGLHGTNISASGATGGGVNIYKTKKVVELTLIPLDQKSPNSQQISYKSQININKEKSQQDLKSGSRNLEEEKDGSLTRSLGRFFKNLF